MTRLAIFDCDGTLIDSQANICRAVEDTFAEARIAVPPHDAIRRIVGLSLVEAMRALVPDAGDTDHHMLAQSYRTSSSRCARAARWTRNRCSTVSPN